VQPSATRSIQKEPRLSGATTNAIGNAIGAFPGVNFKIAPEQSTWPT